MYYLADTPPAPSSRGGKGGHFSVRGYFSAILLLMALSWSAKRQLTVVGILVAVVVLILALTVKRATSEVPTCFDQKQNGDERGIDCGGKCVLYCKDEAFPVAVKFVRTFPVTDTVWNAVAYIENQNSNAAVAKIKYQFKLYDAEQRFITERNGETYIGLTGASAIFEGGIQVGSRTPTSARFSFTSEPYWQRPDVRVSQIGVLGEGGVLTNVDTRPRLSGEIRNTSSLYDVNNVSVVGIAYDAEGNAINVSSTMIPNIAPGEKAPVTFTWQKPFTAPVVKTELIPRFNPFTLPF